MIYMRTCVYEDKVAMQSQKFSILIELSFNRSPMGCRWNEIGYPRGFSYSLATVDWNLEVLGAGGCEKEETRVGIGGQWCGENM